MKITRYFQSCLLVEEGNARLLIDPSGQEAERYDNFGKLNAVLYTHQHGDHFDADLAQRFAAAGVPIYANASTAKFCKTPPLVLEDGKEYDVAGVKIKAIELPHCPMVDGSAGPQNTGLLVNGRLFHPGDGRELDGLQVEILALPITGPDISLRDANDFAKQVGAKTAIPVHYDFIGTKPEVLERLGGDKPYQIKILGISESTEI